MSLSGSVRKDKERRCEWPDCDFTATELLKWGPHDPYKACCRLHRRQFHVIGLPALQRLEWKPKLIRMFRG